MRKYLVGKKNIIGKERRRGLRGSRVRFRGEVMLQITEIRAKSCMGKVFTSILNDRLQQFSESNHIIQETQTGFRQGYSTLEHIFV